MIVLRRCDASLHNVRGIHSTVQHVAFVPETREQANNARPSNSQPRAFKADPQTRASHDEYTMCYTTSTDENGTKKSSIVVV